MSGFRKGLLIFLSTLPALVLLIVLTGSWRMLLTPAVMAFLKDVMRTLWCGLLFGVGMSVFLFVAFTMFDHAKDSRESWKCIPYLTREPPTAGRRLVGCVQACGPAFDR